MCIVIILLFSQNRLNAQNVGDSAYININKIYLPFNKEGVIADVNIPPIGSGGNFNGENFLYSAGFYLSGIIDSVWTNGVMPKYLYQDYQSGTVNIDVHMIPGSAIYKLKVMIHHLGKAGRIGLMQLQLLGADFYDGNGDGLYNPVDLKRK